VPIVFPRLFPISLKPVFSTSDLYGDTIRDINNRLRIANLFPVLLQPVLGNNCINALCVGRRREQNAHSLCSRLLSALQFSAEGSWIFIRPWKQFEVNFRFRFLPLLHFCAFLFILMTKRHQYNHKSTSVYSVVTRLNFYFVSNSSGVDQCMRH
jgi:hypothetical protein